MAPYFSKPSGYAIRALIYLARHSEEGAVLASVIAEEEDIPPSFMGKVLGKLALAGMVDSIRGPNGGYWLVREPAEITMAHIADLFETQNTRRECLLGFKQCPGPKFCALHERWLEPQRHIDNFLNNTTLADLIRDSEEREALKVTARETGKTRSQRFG